MTNSRRNAEAAYTRAKAAEDKGDVAEAERALKEYGAARDAYNRFASMRGEAGMAQADLSVRAFPKLNQYVTKNKQFPSGRRSTELERKGASRGAPAGGGAAKPKSFPGTDAEWRAMTAAEQKLFM